MSMKRIGLIACCKQKLSTPAAAKDLYCSPLFRASRCYVEPRCHEWAILSAKYGLVLSDQVIAPYDLTLHQLKPQALRDWADQTHQQIVERWPHWGSTIFLVIASGRYRMAIGDRRVQMPFGELPIGMLLQRINAANSPEVTCAR